jgi:hypothetical protein
MISNITLYINKIREIVDPMILSYKTHVALLITQYINPCKKKKKSIIYLKCHVNII